MPRLTQSPNVSSNPKRHTFQLKRYEILEGLPSYGPMYIPISEDGIPFYYEGYVIRFYKSDETNWIANFKCGNTNFQDVLDYPKQNRIVVFAKGTCYIMTADTEVPIKAFGVGILNAFQTEDGFIILPDQTDVSVININNDEVWHSERISWDGLAELKFENDILTGLAYEPTSDDGEWKPFSFNFRTKELIGETYFYDYKKPWWKFW